MAIVLVRHGETDGNATRVIQQPDTPLSARGLAQAARLAERLSGHRIAGIVSSDYARAAMTAEAVRDRCRAPLELLPSLRERHFGELRGRAYASLGFDPFAEGFAPPGGETWEALHRRVDAVWSALRERAAASPDDLVVVTHGLVCHSLVARHLDTSAVEIDTVSFGNTSVTLIDPAPPWPVRLLACTAHLDAVTAHDHRTVSGL